MAAVQRGDAASREAELRHCGNSRADGVVWVGAREYLQLEGATQIAGSAWGSGVGSDDWRSALKVPPTY